ncbi:M15 family metallopeptidase domain-containing protein [Devosia sp. A449]
MKRKSLLTLMQERQNRLRVQEIHLHPNRNYRGALTLPEPPPPPIFAEPAGPSKGLPDALAGLVNRPFLATETWREQQRRAVREGAHPKVLKFEAAFIRRMKRVGIPMWAHCVIRSEYEQAEMVRNGVSKDSPDDGLWPHRGCAVDLIHSVKGWQMNDDEWKLIGHLGKEISAQMGLSMQWGGDWSFYDPAHWEVKNWKTIAGEYPWLPK